MKPGNEQVIPDKLWTKEFVLIIASNLLMYLSFMMVTPVLPAYVAEVFGDNKVIVSLVTSLFALSAIVARAFSGGTLDIFGRKRMLFVGVLIFTLSTVGYFLAGTIALFLFLGWSMELASGWLGQLMERSLPMSFLRNVWEKGWVIMVCLVVFPCQLRR